MTMPIGLTKREHIASMILGGMYANPDFPALQFDSAAKMAIDQADALLEMLAGPVEEMTDEDKFHQEYYRPLYSTEFVKRSDRTDPLDCLQHFDPA